jgi:hypothetical protein
MAADAENDIVPFVLRAIEARCAEDAGIVKSAVATPIDRLSFAKYVSTRNTFAVLSILGALVVVVHEPRRRSG